MNIFEAVKTNLENQIHVQEDYLDNGEKILRFNLTIDGGANLQTIIFFNNNDIQCCTSYIQINNAYKKPEFLNLINGFNLKYKIPNLRLEDDNLITSSLVIHFLDKKFNYNADDPEIEKIVALIIVSIKALNDSYPQFMRLQWA